METMTTATEFRELAKYAGVLQSLLETNASTYVELQVQGEVTSLVNHALNVIDDVDSMDIWHDVNNGVAKWIANVNGPEANPRQAAVDMLVMLHWSFLTVAVRL